MNSDDKIEIAEIVSKTILRYESNRPGFVAESICKERTGALHNQLLEVHEGVRQIQIDLTDHIAEHRGETTGRRILASRRSEIYKLTGLILLSVSAIAGAVLFIVSK